MFQCINLFQNVQSLLLLWHHNKLVYPPELSRIAGFCTNSNKNFLGEDPQTPLSSRIVRACIITNNTANHLKKLKTHTQISPPPIFLANSESLPPTIFLANSESNGLCMSYLKSQLLCMSSLKSPLLIIFSRMDVWKNKEKSLKTPWKCTSKVLENSLKKGMPWSVGTMLIILVNLCV